jgi:hypothetical protein
MTISRTYEALAVFFLDGSLFLPKKLLHWRFYDRKGRSLWQPTKRRNAHIQFVRVRSVRRSIAARSARRWKKPRTWIASAPTRSARVGRNTRPTHSHRRRPTRRIRAPFIGVSSTVQIVTGKVGAYSFRLVKSLPRETFWPSPVKPSHRNMAQLNMSEIHRRLR